MHHDQYTKLVELREHILGTEYIPQNSPVTQHVIRVIDEEIRMHKKANGHHHDAARLTTSRQPYRRLFFVASVLRFLLFDCTLAILFFLLLVTHSIHYMHTHFYSHIMESSNWRHNNRLQNEFTYYDRHCADSDVSTQSAFDFTLHDHSTVDDAVKSTMIHGMVKFPSILSNSTALNLRSFILKRNEELTVDEAIPLDGPLNRWSFAIGVNDDVSVSTALKEISSNAILTDTLEKLLGLNPAVVEITAITAAFGADHQGWHPDVKPLASSVKYARTFTHSYSLFIPLQPTTAKMGATEVCPGTHYCSNDLRDTCLRKGFQVAGDDEFTVWNTGDAVLMNQCTWHRGYAHTDPNGPQRVVFIMTFISRPRPGLDYRQLSHGTYFHIRPDMYGNTLYDLQVPESWRFKKPFRILRTLGIWAPSNAHYGWDWPTTTSLRISNHENGYQFNDLVTFVSQNSIVKSLPRFMLGDVTEDGGWQEFIAGTTFRIKQICSFLYGLFFAFYILLAIIGAQVDIKSFWRSMHPVLRCTLISHLPMVMLIIYMRHHIHQSTWGQCATRGTIFAPFVSKEVSVLPERISTLAETNDVLIGIRYDARHLGYYNHFLDYHPGNRLWLNTVSSFGQYIDSYDELPRVLGQHLVSLIHKEVKNVNGRFLLQEEDGVWTLLNDGNAIQHTIRSIMISKNKLLATMDEEIRFLKARARYETSRFIRSTSTLKKQTLKLLQKWEITFFPHLSTIEAKTKYLHSHGSATFRAVSSLKSIPSLNRRRNSQPSSTTTIERVPKFSPDELVEANYQNEGVWFLGVISTFMAVNDTTVDVVYLDGDRETLDLENIRKYTPILKGSEVHTHYRECDDCPLHWKSGIVTEVYPDRSYDIQPNEPGEFLLHRVSIEKISKQ